MIISKTPYRVSLFGGGTDYPDWYRVHGGAVISFAINRYCYISARYLPQFFEHKYRFVYSNIENVNEVSEIIHPAIRGVLTHTNWDDGIEVHHDGDLPARSGIGSSSSFTVGFLNALAALKGGLLSKKELADQALHVEQKLLLESVGSQDQIIAAYGGFNKITFPKLGNFAVDPVILPPDALSLMESRLVLIFTGISRFSGDIAASKIANIPQKESQLNRILAMVERAVFLLQNSSNSNLDEIGEMLHESWCYKKELSPLVTNSVVDQVYETGRKAGAIGGKPLGAGGGGFILFWVRPESRSAVISSLSSYVHVPIKIDFEGSRIALYQPEGI